MKSTHVDNLTLIVLWMMQSDERSLWENGKMWYYSMNWNDFMWYSNSVKCFFFFFFPCKGLKHEKKKSRSSYCNLLVCIPTSMSLHSSVHLVLVKKKKKKKSFCRVKMELVLIRGSQLSFPYSKTLPCCSVKISCA